MNNVFDFFVQFFLEKLYIYDKEKYFNKAFMRVFSSNLRSLRFVDEVEKKSYISILYGSKITERRIKS